MQVYRSLKHVHDKVPFATNELHGDVNLERAVDLALLHEIAARYRICVVVAATTTSAGTGRNVFDILRQVKIKHSERDALAFAATRVFLQDFEMYRSLLQHLIFTDNEADGYDFVVVVQDFMVLDGRLWCPTAVLRCSR